MFEIPEVTTDTARVVLRWGTLAVPFTVNTNTAAKVLASARAAVSSAAPTDWRTPMRAAGFALDNRMNAEAALWVDQSLKAEQNINNLYLKARV